MVAFSTYLRLNKAQMWRPDCAVSLHKKISNTIKFENSAKEDLCSRTWNLHKKYKITLNERENWSYGLNITNNPNCWFTDGSKKDNRTAIGVFNPVKNKLLSKRTSDHSNIMQSELKAIEECAKLCMTENYFNKKILIISDSRSALCALNKAIIESTTVSECVEVLNTLAENNELTLAWCPSHSGILGNEEADRLANEGIKNEFVQIQVAVGEKIVENKIIDWGKKEAIKIWNQDTGIKHSKICISPFDCKKANYLLNFPKADIRTIIGITSGHVCTNVFLKRIGKSTHERCRFCNEQNSRETVLHFLQNCPKLQLERHRTLNDGTPSETRLKGLSYKTLIKFASRSEIRKIILKPVI